VIGGTASRPAGPPLDQWQSTGHLVWSMQNIASFLPTRSISRGERVTTFREAHESLAALSVRHPWEDRVLSFGEVMESTNTDGWIVTRDGAIVDEGYTEPMTRDSVHLLMSVSKSFTAATAGVLIGAGILDAERLVTDYVPALLGSGYVGAKVQHLLDMRTGIHFSEDYLDEAAEVRLLEEAIDWAPRVHEGVQGTLLGFLASLHAERGHGGRFDYKSCETDVLGFVIEGATLRHTTDVMSERLWAPMGAEQDANVGVDSAGEGMFDGGVSARLRDLARFGSLFVRGGHALDGVPVLPASWLESTFAGGFDSREAFAASTEETLMPGGMYRNGFWFPRAGSDVFLALGIHGQMIYVNRAARVVAAKVSTWASPQHGERLLTTIAAFDAAAQALSPR
jgi:CubicO group peptidase (beta-lactamase class C family)